jgi:hypothetical protein
MFRNPQACIAHSVNQWGMMIEILELTISCMKGRGTYTRYEVKYTKKEIMHNTTLKGEEISLLAVAIEDEDEEEVWTKVKEKLSVITLRSQDT